MNRLSDIVVEGRLIAGNLHATGNIGWMDDSIIVDRLCTEVTRLQEQLQIANNKLVDKVFQPPLSSEMLKALDAIDNTLANAYKTFYSSPPFEPTLDELAQEQNVKPITDVKVLVIDDVPDNPNARYAALLSLRPQTETVVTTYHDGSYPSFVGSATTLESADLVAKAIMNFRRENGSWAEGKILADEVEQLQAEIHWVEKVEMKVLQKEIERQRTVIGTLETADWFSERARANSLEFEVERLQKELENRDQTNYVDSSLIADNNALQAEVDHMRTLIVYYETRDVSTPISARRLYTAEDRARDEAMRFPS